MEFGASQHGYTLNSAVHSARKSSESATGFYRRRPEHIQCHRHLNDKTQGYRTLIPIRISWNTNFELLRNTTIKRQQQISLQKYIYPISVTCDTL
jgi:hypothetical protein